MPTHKKARTQVKGKAAAGSKRTARRQSEPTVDSQTVQLLIICFTVLCMVFAMVAFWRFG